MSATVPAAPPRDHRHVRHSPTTIAMARRMYGDGDSWTPTQIRRYIGRHGLPVPSESTIRRWLIPSEAAASQQAAKMANRKRRAVRARIIELRFEAGLSYLAIGLLIRHDHGAEAHGIDREKVKLICDEHEASL